MVGYAMRIGFTILVSSLPEERARYADESFRICRESLSRYGDLIDYHPVIYSDVDPSSLEGWLEGLDGLILYVWSGGTDNLIRDIVELYGGPTFIYSHPHHNSLASVREAIAVLRMEGLKYFFGYGEAGELGSIVEPYIKAIYTVSRLKGSRIGIVGRPEPWILIRRGDELLSRRFGIEAIHIDWDKLYDYSSRVGSEEVEEMLKEVLDGFKYIDVSTSNIEKSIRIYYGLRRIIDEYGLSSLAVEARDMLEENLRDYGPYLAVSILSSNGIPSDYEVDIDAILTKLILYYLTGSEGFMANITVLDRDRNTVILSHCTIPIGMINMEYSRLTTYFETGRSVAIRGRLYEREATIARLGGMEMDEMMVAKGLILDGDVGRGDLCRTQALVRIDGDIDRLIYESLGNHVIMVYGDWIEHIKVFTDILDIDLIEI